jgi:hypothetical protein
VGRLEKREGVGSVGRGEGKRRRICPGSGGYKSFVDHETWLLNQVFLFLIKSTPILANGCGGRDGWRAHTRESPCGRSLASFVFIKNCLGLFCIVIHRPRPNPPSSPLLLPSFLCPSLPPILPTYSPSSFLPSYILPSLPISSPPSLLPPLPLSFPPNFQIPYVTFFLGRPL